MGSSEIRDLVKAIKENTFVNIKAIEARYRSEQFKESTKVPKSWNVYTVLIPANTPVFSVFPRNPKRSGLVVTNTGLNPVYYNGRYFDITEAIQTLSGTSQGVTACGVLIANGSISLANQGPFYAGTGSAGASTLTIVETLFLEETKDSSKTTNQLKPAHSVEGSIQHLVQDLV